MSTCARCGHRPDMEGKDCNSDASARLHCRDRELANLRALLRSVTGKVEMSLEAISVPYYSEDVDREHVVALLNQVLEALS